MTVGEQVVQILDVLCEKFGIAVDWTSANVIPYAEILCGKLVTYEIFTSAVSIVIWVALCVAMAFATKKLYPVIMKKIDEQDWADFGWSALGTFAACFLVTFGIVAFACVYTEIMDIIKCATFPEMYVFEYVQGIISGG